jgi:hypothetical protein
VETAELTRLRVAQAARVPVTAERVVELLAGDEDASSLSIEQVESAFDDWIEEGLVEALPGKPKRYVQAAVWVTELHRRIAGHLLRPRNLQSLQAECRSDPYVGSFDLDTLGQYVDVLANADLVKSVGEHADSESLADAVDGDPEVIDLHPDSRKALIERLASPVRAWQLEGAVFVLTRKGLDALQVT